MSATHGILERFAIAVWYGGNPARYLLWPFTVLFAALAAFRRWTYDAGLRRRYKAPVPVIVVGNITVGGTGKTPVTLWLVQRLQEAGMRPAIVSRGYGGKAGRLGARVTADSDPAMVGDEPVLLALRSEVPVFVDRHRVDAARAAVRDGANVIVSDDGLQHYALRRDAEIAVVDGQRGFGNGFLLPAGPLREPPSRLLSTDFVMVQVANREQRAKYGNRKSDKKAVARFRLSGDTLHQVAGDETQPLSSMKGKTVRALAGIGNPDRFFHLLESFAIDVKPVALPDHASIEAGDIDFGGDEPVIMTEKDAVKCRNIAGDRHWYLPVDVELLDDDSRTLLDVLIARLTGGRENRE